jgi:hypothetical protein
MELKDDEVLARVWNEPPIPVGLASALVPAILGIWAMRQARMTLPGICLSPGLIGTIGFFFWTGLVFGPLMSPLRCNHTRPMGRPCTPATGLIADRFMVPGASRKDNH